MAEFDNNQSAIQYGESLLASRENERKKQRKRKKRIDRVNIALAGVSIADSFLTRNARKKVSTFTNNLTADKAHTLNQFNLATAFKTNELESLQKINPGLDYNNPNSWNLTLDANNKVLKSGSVYNALKKEYSENLRADYGIGSTGNVDPQDFKDYRKNVEKQTVQAYKALEAKYAKFKPSLGTSQKLIENQYQQLIEEGSKQILSGRNTSSIRKLLSKFGIADNVNEDLERVEMGGVNLYLSKDLIKNQTDRKTAQADATARYEELIKKRGDAQIKADDSQITKGTNTARIRGRSIFAAQFKGFDTYSFQSKASDDGMGGVPQFDSYGSSNQTAGDSPYKVISSVAFSHKDNDNKKAPLLAALPAGNGKTIPYVKLHDKLISTGRHEDLKKIQVAADIYFTEAMEEAMESQGIKDSSILRMFKEDYARAKYNAVMDLVTISNNGNTIKVKTYEEAMNAKALGDVEAAETRNRLIEEGNNKKRPTLYIDPDDKKGIRYLRKGDRIETLDSEFDDFFTQIQKAVDEGKSTRILLEGALDSSFPVEVHGEVLEFYKRAIEEREPLYHYSPFTPMSTIVKDVESRDPFSSTIRDNERKKKIIDRPLVTVIDRPLVTERTDNITTLVNAHMTGLNKDKSKRFNILNTDKAISNLLDVFVPAVLEIESKGDYQAINKEGSGARGGFQFLGKSKKYPKGSAIAALNRLEKYLGKREWGAELRKHGDASLLEPMQQTELFIGDMLEKDGSDKFMQLVFDGDMEGMIQAYEVMHHTKADPKTKARARKIFSTYFN